MGKANPYIHIPKESWPNWTWYAIECVALIVIAFFSAVLITDTFEGLTTEQHNYVITGIFASFFLVWYVLITCSNSKKENSKIIN